MSFYRKLESDGESNEDQDLVNILTRVATDLERLLVGTYTCAGLLGFIALLMLLRLMIGR